MNGVKKLLASNAVGSGSGTLRFDALGASLTLSLNDTPLVSATDTSLKTGHVGLLASGSATLDDFAAHVA